MEMHIVMFQQVIFIFIMVKEFLKIQNLIFLLYFIMFYQKT